MREATEEAAPAKRFAHRGDAVAAAAEITRTPRRGDARAQYTGAWDCWIVEVHLRANPYGRAGVLRENGIVAKYPY